MVGFVVNIVIASIGDSLDSKTDEIGGLNPSPDSREYPTLQFILGAPVIPSVALLIAVYFCYESPRFYMREDSPNFNPQEALRILQAIRPTKVGAKETQARLNGTDRLVVTSHERLHPDSLFDETKSLKRER